MARKQMASPPEEGAQAPEFNLPGAQGGQLRLGLRTARGPVIVVFYRGAWCAECAEYFKALAERDREINVAGATLVGIGPAEPEEAREFVRETGFKSYVLYDYVRRTTREYGLLQKDSEHGDAARPAVFLVGSDRNVIRSWLDERPAPEELLAEVSKITGLPKEPEEGEAEEKPKRRPRKAADGESAGGKSEEGGEDRAAKRAASSSGDASSGDAEAGASSDSKEEKAAAQSGEEAASEEASDTPAGDETKGPEAADGGGSSEPSESEERSGDPGASKEEDTELGSGTVEEGNPASSGAQGDTPANKEASGEDDGGPGSRGEER